MTRCPSALTADFFRYYGHSISQFRAAGVPLRDVAAMAAHLPPESATARALNADWLWTLDAQLLALIVDRLGSLDYVLRRLAGAKNVKPPEPLPRPGVASQAGNRERIRGDVFDSAEDFEAWYSAQPGGRPLRTTGG